MKGQSSSGANNVYFEDFDMSLKDSAYGMDDDFDGNEGDNDDESILDENTFEHGQSCNVEEGTGYSVLFLTFNQQIII